jgi:hypothetical protein
LRFQRGCAIREEVAGSSVSIQRVAAAVGGAGIGADPVESLRLPNREILFT